MVGIGEIPLQDIILASALRRQTEAPLFGQREGNRILIEILKANVTVFRCLPGGSREVFVSHLMKFVTECLESNVWQQAQRDRYCAAIADTATVSSCIIHLFRQEDLMRAANEANPAWLLGIREHGTQFVFVDEEERWIRVVNPDHAGIIMQRRGVESVLIVPPTIDIARLSELTLNSNDNVMPGNQDSNHGIGDETGNQSDNTTEDGTIQESRGDSPKYVQNVSKDDHGNSGLASMPKKAPVNRSESMTSIVLDDEACNELADNHDMVAPFLDEYDVPAESHSSLNVDFATIF